MIDDAAQGMLFGSLSAPPKDRTERPSLTGKLTLCAFNVNSPSRGRAQGIADWLLGINCNALVLTEMQSTEGCRLIMNCLEAEGYEIIRSPGWQDSRYCAVIASAGMTAGPVSALAFDPRVIAADLEVGDVPVRLVAIYGPTNGMSSESSQRRSVTRRRILGQLTAVRHPRMIVAGDLNVIEPEHRPHLESFEVHDYAFYTGLLGLGLADAYRVTCPDGMDHSWISDRFGSQRLDHMLASSAVGHILACGYDHAPRLRRLSDHAALLATFQLPAGSSGSV